MISQDDVLRVEPGASVPVDVDAPDLQRLHRQALRRQHVAHLRGADPERQGAERAVRRGVTVAADDRHARLGQPELRPDHMDDALATAVEVEEAGCPTRARCARAPTACPRPSRRRTAAADRAWGRCGRPSRSCAPETATFHPRARSMSNACGVVTSWIRCRPMNSCVCPFGQLADRMEIPDFLEERGGHGEWYVRRSASRRSAVGVRRSAFGVRRSKARTILPEPKEGSVSRPISVVMFADFCEPSRCAAEAVLRIAMTWPDQELSRAGGLEARMSLAGPSYRLTDVVSKAGAIRTDAQIRRAAASIPGQYRRGSQQAIAASVFGTT